MNRVEKSWYQPFGFVTLLLLPLSLLFFILSSIRKYLYAFGIKKEYKAPCPVIVVGNIGVGGNGKTPFVLWVVPFLQSLGLKVAVISRGYGGNPPHTPYQLNQDSSPNEAGDEPFLIFKRLGIPVVTGPNRQASIEYLHKEIMPDIIVSDDGLQHYAMGRDVELCIVDGQRKFGNGFLLPAGPLRESTRRLDTVDLTIFNGGNEALKYDLIVSGLYQVNNHLPIREEIKSAVAVSAIGNPLRFEQTLESEGVSLLDTAHFADHHKFSPDDFTRFGDNPVIMTEKDAVKCQHFAKPNWYYLKVATQPSELLEKSLTKLLIDKEIINHGIR